MLNVKMDLAAINAKLDGITKAANSAVREASQAGAEVFYVEMKMRAPVSEKAHWFYGTHDRYFFRSGTLRDSIYQYYNKRLSTPTHAIYSIAWNHKKAPYGYMVEFGTSNAPAHPFMRPAYSSAKTLAQQVVLATLAASIKSKTA